MADRLFDNRYRYDYTYPRGRSGETIRAVDTQHGNRYVVIKRPAVGDSPQVRSEQEASIATESKALRLLHDHPAVPELLDEGHFQLGAMPHRYIVMEQAEGTVIGTVVDTLAMKRQHLPILEILPILDQLLDLLEVAHERGIVYNDVDVNHLFWQRENRKLMVIDWGNAVILGGKAANAMGISHQTDIYQVGELLYYIFTGGERLRAERDAGANFQRDFGEQVEQIPEPIRQIINRASHPNANFRYATATELRQALAAYREPLEKQRNETLQVLLQQMKEPPTTKGELQQILTETESLVELDPNFTPVKELNQEVVDKLRELELSANIDAIRIYMEGNNWHKALELLEVIKNRASSATRNVVDLLSDICVIMIDTPFNPVPERVHEAVSLIFEGNIHTAATNLLQNPPTDTRTHGVYDHIAERIATHMPEIPLLRPNLQRLNRALRQLENEGINAGIPRQHLEQAEKTLDDITEQPTPDIGILRDEFQSLVKQLTDLNPILNTFQIQHELSEAQLPVTALEQAMNASMMLTDNIHIIGKNAVTDSNQAVNALDVCQGIDPVNPVWEHLENYLNSLYSLLKRGHDFSPSHSGISLGTWLQDTQTHLTQAATKAFDSELTNMAEDSQTVEQAWDSYQEATLLGKRTDAASNLTTASDHTQNFSPQLSTWFQRLHTTITESPGYIEKHSPNLELGQQLATGWKAFDESDLAQSESAGEKALSLATTEVESQVAHRLHTLAKHARIWIEQEGYQNRAITKAALTYVEQLLTEEERNILQEFNQQMPSLETYLRAMKKGVVDIFATHGTAALHILYTRYILLGAVDALEGRIPDGEFWYQAAQTVFEGENNSFGDHVLSEYLEACLEDHAFLMDASQQFEILTDQNAIPKLDEIQSNLRNNPQALDFSASIASIGRLQQAITHWERGKFQDASQELDVALTQLRSSNKPTLVDTGNFEAWLIELKSTVDTLYAQQMQMQHIVAHRPTDPDPQLQTIHRSLHYHTDTALGESHATQFREWYETYQQFLKIYTDSTQDTEAKLQQFNKLFRKSDINQHPAYRIYRTWYDAIEQQSSGADLLLDETRNMNITTSLDVQDLVFLTDQYAEERAEEEAQEVHQQSRSRLVPAVIGLIFVGLVGGIIILLTRPPGENPTVISTSTAIGSEATDAVALNVDPENINLFVPTPISFASPPQPVANNAQGEQSMLLHLAQLDEVYWEQSAFQPNPDGASWKFGIGHKTEPEILSLGVPAEYLDAWFGEDTGTRITQTQASFTIRTINAEVISSEDIFFGILLYDIDSQQVGGVEIKADNPTNIQISQVNGDQLTWLTNQDASDQLVHIQIDRNPANGQIQLVVNGEPVGEPYTIFDPNSTVVPILFAKHGGLVINIDQWEITLAEA